MITRYCIVGFSGLNRHFTFSRVVEFHQSVEKYQLVLRIGSQIHSTSYPDITLLPRTWVQSVQLQWISKKMVQYHVFSLHFPNSVVKSKLSHSFMLSHDLGIKMLAFDINAVCRTCKSQQFVSRSRFWAWKLLPGWPVFCVLGKWVHIYNQNWSLLSGVVNCKLWNDFTFREVINFNYSQ